MISTPNTRSEVVKYAVEKIAEATGRRVAAGCTFEAAANDSIAEMAERWPNLADHVARSIGFERINRVRAGRAYTYWMASK